MKIKKVLLSAATTLCLTAGMWAQTVIPAYVPTNSLVGWWPFNGNANDLSVNANNGTVNGATLTADRFGSANKAYGFDGYADYIDCGNGPSVNITGAITINSWIYAQDLNDQRGVLTKSPLPPLGNAYQLVAGAYTLTELNFLNSNTGYSVSLTNWVHVVSVFDAISQKIKLYINGALFYTQNVSFSSIGISNDNLYLGTHRPTFTPNWSWYGKLDDIGIWSRALTECEIKKLYYSPAFTVSASTSSICVGQSLTLNAGGVPNYSWSNGANTSSTVVSPTVSTIYTVTSTYTTGCSDTKTISVTVNACTGINDLTKENSLSIYPNPAKESITITSTNALAGKFYVIHDAIGKQVANGILSPEKTNVSLTGLSAGLYILSVEGNLNQTYKFVKE
jgi:hypothetical protein